MGGMISGISGGIIELLSGMREKKGMNPFIRYSFCVSILLLTLLQFCHSQHDHHDSQGQQEEKMTSVSLDTMSAENSDSHAQVHSNHGSAGSYSGHQMHFFTSTNSTILFLEWTTSSWQSLLLACFLLFITTVLYEGLGVLALHISTVSLRIRSKPLGDRDTVYMKSVTLHLFQTLVHVIRLILAYALMLVFMTFNLWLCIPIVIGAATGFLAFGWMRATAIPPHDMDGGHLANDIKLDQCH